MGPAPLPAGLALADPVVRDAIQAAWSQAEASPSSAEARLQLALLLDANGFDKAADTAWSGMATLVPADGRPAYFKALQAAERDDLDAAIAGMKQVRALAPTHSPAAWRAGYWHLDLGATQAARELFEHALDVEPTAAAAAIGLARADLALDRTDAAIKRLRELVDLTGHPYTVYLLGQALRRAGRGEEAAALPIRGTPSVPRFPDTWYAALLDAQRGLDAELGRADRLLEDDDLENAHLAIKRALVTWPDNVHLLNRLSEVHRRSNDTAKWVHALERAVRLDPNSFQSQLNLSIALRAAGDQERSLRAAIIAARLKPDVPEGHLQVARMHLVANRPAEAVVALDAAFALGVTDPLEQVQYANTLLQVGRLEDALDRINAVLKVTPTLPVGWIVLAKAHERAGQLSIALESAREGVRHNPGDGALRQLVRELERKARR